MDHKRNRSTPRRGYAATNGGYGSRDQPTASPLQGRCVSPQRRAPTADWMGSSTPLASTRTPTPTSIRGRVTATPKSIARDESPVRALPSSRTTSQFEKELISRMDRKIDSMQREFSATVSSLESQIAHLRSSGGTMVITDAAPDPLTALKEELQRESDGIPPKGRPYGATCRAIKSAIHRTISRQLADWVELWETGRQDRVSKTDADTRVLVLEQKNQIERAIPSRLDALENRYSQLDSHLHDLEQELSTQKEATKSATGNRSKKYHDEIFHHMKHTSEALQDGMRALSDGVEDELQIFRNLMSENTMRNDERLVRIENTVNVMGADHDGTLLRDEIRKVREDVMKEVAEVDEIIQRQLSQEAARKRALEDRLLKLELESNSDTEKRLRPVLELLRDEMYENDATSRKRLDAHDKSIRILQSDDHGTTNNQPPPDTDIKIKFLTKEIEDLKNNNIDTQAGTHAMQKQLGELTTKIEIMRPKKDDGRVEQRMARLEHDMQDGQAQQDSMQKQLHELAAKVEYKPKSRVLPTPSDGLDQRVAQMEGDLEGLQDLQNSMRQQLNEMSVRPKRPTSPIHTHSSGLDQRVAQLEADLEDSEGNIIKHIDELRTRVDSLATTRRRPTGDVGVTPDQLESRIRQVCEELEDAEGGLRRQIDELSSRIDTLPTKSRTKPTTSDGGVTHEQLENRAIQLTEDLEETEAGLRRLIEDVINRVEALGTKSRSKSGDGAAIAALEGKLRKIGDDLEQSEEGLRNQVADISSRLEALARRRPDNDHIEGKLRTLSTEVDDLSNAHRTSAAALQKLQNDLDRLPPNLKKQLEEIRDLIASGDESVRNANSHRISDLERQQRDVESKFAAYVEEISQVTARYEAECSQMVRDVDSWRDRVAALQETVADVQGYQQTLAEETDRPLMEVRARLFKVEEQLNTEIKKTRRQLDVVANSQSPLTAATQHSPFRNIAEE